MFALGPLNLPITANYKNLALSAYPSLSGLSATGAVGTIAVRIGVYVTNVSATGYVGNPTVSLLKTVSLTGLSAAGNLGTLGIRVTIYTTGVQTTTAVGTPTVAAAATAYPVGLSAQGLTGNILIWEIIPPGPGGGWTQVVT